MISLWSTIQGCFYVFVFVLRFIPKPSDSLVNAAVVALCLQPPVKMLWFCVLVGTGGSVPHD